MPNFELLRLLSILILFNVASSRRVIEMKQFQLGNLLQGLNPYCDVHILQNLNEDRINFTSHYIWPTTIISIPEIGTWFTKYLPKAEWNVGELSENMRVFAIDTLRTRGGFTCRVNVIISSKFRDTYHNHEFMSLNKMANNYHLKYLQWWILSPKNMTTILFTFTEFVDKNYDFSYQLYLENFAIAVSNHESVQLFIPSSPQELDVSKIKPITKIKAKDVTETINEFWKPSTNWGLLLIDEVRI
jgi:hypothetical protein